MKCLLCKEREANKDNTHYLTDSIIRQALNVESSNVRGKGSYHDMSPDKGTIDYKFQQRVLSETIEENLGRPATDKEIEDAKSNIEFSVDKHYCDVCEDLFGEIEDPFCDDILPMFRNADLNNIKSVEVSDVKKIRLFFYLQLLRSSDCHDGFDLPISLQTSFREWILSHDKITYSAINSVPLSVAYLQTLNEQYNQNVIGLPDGQNPNIVVMNDFVIQCYEVGKEQEFYELPVINQKDDFNKFLNKEEEKFLVKVIADTNRKMFFERLSYQDKYNSIIKACGKALYQPYLDTFGIVPTREITEYFYYHEVHSSSDPKGVMHTTENYKEKALIFIEKHKERIFKILNIHN